MRKEIPEDQMLSDLSLFQAISWKRVHGLHDVQEIGTKKGMLLNIGHKPLGEIQGVALKVL